VHINELANDQFQRHVLFRDYLRAHPDAVRDYENLKRELAARFDEVGPSADNKSAFVQDILAKARLWREGEATRSDYRQDSGGARRDGL
jgi:GrpB-like predicted nucleotidyltransferase (UPF0157 family)